jgi:predicted nucleic acid-binding protein
MAIMSAYWDSSALVETTKNPELRLRLRNERGITRTHSLAEVFAALTGNPQFRFDSDYATQTIEELTQDLDFTDLSSSGVISALKKAKRKGVRGGHVHDLLHAAAADKSGAKQLLTLDTNDFRGLPEKAQLTTAAIAGTRIPYNRPVPALHAIDQLTCESH